MCELEITGQAVVKATGNTLCACQVLALAADPACILLW